MSSNELKRYKQALEEMDIGESINGSKKEAVLEFVKVHKNYACIVLGVFFLLLLTDPAFIKKKTEGKVDKNINVKLFLKYWIVISLCISAVYTGYKGYKKFSNRDGEHESGEKRCGSCGK